MLGRYSEDVVKICVRTCDMTERSYFGEQNLTLVLVMPLAMFNKISDTISIILRAPLMSCQSASGDLF